MSGHSKWHSIRHQKAANDAKRGQAFTRLANAISAAAKQGGGDPDGNVRLRMAIEAARAANMPKDNVERAIKRGTGELAGQIIEEFTIEAFGPGGAGLLINVITDNRNRALSDVRHILSRQGGSPAGQGAVGHMFEQRGVIRYSLTSLTEEMEEAVIDSGATNYAHEGSLLTVETDRTQLRTVRETLEQAGLSNGTAQLEQVATTTIELNESDQAKLLALLEKLDENDDVSAISTNVDGF